MITPDNIEAIVQTGVMVDNMTRMKALVTVQRLIRVRQEVTANELAKLQLQRTEIDEKIEECREHMNTLDLANIRADRLISEEARKD